MIDLTPGLRDELLTAAAGEALLRVEDELIEIAELERTEAPERFARHAGAVVRRLLERMRDDDASAEAQALAVNEIIGALTDEDVISLPPSVLTGVRRPAVGLGTSILPPGPMIALSANELLVNGHAQPAIGQQIRSELPSATDVDFLVSFVRWTGVRTLVDELAQVVERGGRVRVITTTYMSATEPKALEALAKAGAHVRVDYEADRTKLHAKAWVIHRPGGLTTAFLGSSNISYAALHQGMEWNVRLSEVATASLVERMRATFETYWSNEAFEPYDPEQDGQRLREALDRQRRAKRRNLGGGFVAFDVTPKPHQARMLEQLQAQRDRHDRHRNLLVAATGTGKTVMAALDYRRLCDHLGRKPTLLFIAHRRRILDQSRATYATVLRDPDFGEILGDGEQPLVGRHVFAMVQSLHNDAVEALDPNAFEVVVIDEVHHAAAPSYRALLQVHARYTRDEALLALGDGTFEKPPTSREGVRWLSDLRTDVLFVTLRKSERRYSPSTRYRDYALSSQLFHWESQSTTSADSPTGRRYRQQHQHGTNVLLFVRESPTLANGAGAPFTLLGPATFVEARGERPIQITWRLREPMPESLLEVARLVAA